jgi:hypothetical protein
MIGHLDDRGSVIQIDVLSGDGMIRDIRQVQAGIEKFTRMVDAILDAGPAAFEDDGWTQVGKGDRLHTVRPDEVHHGTAEQGRQLKKAVVYAVHTGVMRIGTGVVVDIDAGKHAAVSHDVHDRAHHGMLGRALTVPDAVVIGLVVEAAPAIARRRHVADEDRHRPRQFLPAVITQQGLHRAQAGILIAVLKCGDEQRRFTSAFQVDQCRPAQDLVQLRCLDAEQFFRYFMKGC